jgi:hypothetical protein
MAISAPHYRLFKSLKPILPVGGSLLEIGEANWYGDVEPDFPHAIFSDDTRLFDIAKWFYGSLFDPSQIVSIDFNGTPAALKQNLNAPLDLGGETFDICINHGTAEHIFNIAQVFRTMHDHTVDGGLMIHESPCTGWIDHGFYCLQPTLFYDIAAANCYEIVMVALEHIDTNWTHRLESRDELTRLEVPNNTMLYVVFRKRGEGPFKIPMQGYYSRSLSDAGMKAWETRR